MSQLRSREGAGGAGSPAGIDAAGGWAPLLSARLCARLSLPAVTPPLHFQLLTDINFSGVFSVDKWVVGAGSTCNLGNFSLKGTKVGAAGAPSHCVCRRRRRRRHLTRLSPCCTPQVSVGFTERDLQVASSMYVTLQSEACAEGIACCAR